MSKIIGNTTATPVPRSDWAQTDEAKVDYIKNKPTLGALALKDDITLADLGVTSTATELNYVDGVTSNIQDQLNAKVPTSRTINGKPLTGNITLSASDVGAYTKSEIDNLELITVEDIDTICGTTIQVATASEVTF